MLAGSGNSGTLSYSQTKAFCDAERTGNPWMFKPGRNPTNGIFSLSSCVMLPEWWSWSFRINRKAPLLLLPKEKNQLSEEQFSCLSHLWVLSCLAQCLPQGPHSVNFGPINKWTKMLLLLADKDNECTLRMLLRLPPEPLPKPPTADLLRGYRPFPDTRALRELRLEERMGGPSRTKLTGQISF